MASAASSAEIGRGGGSCSSLPLNRLSPSPLSVLWPLTNGFFAIMASSVKDAVGVLAEEAALARRRALEHFRRVAVLESDRWIERAARALSVVHLDHVAAAR